MSNTNPQAVQAHLERTVEQGATPSDQRLEFDPATGQLVVQRKNAPKSSPDAVVADQIAEEGFFTRK